MTPIGTPTLVDTKPGLVAVDEERLGMRGVRDRHVVPLDIDDAAQHGREVAVVTDADEVGELGENRRGVVALRARTRGSRSAATP